MKITDDFLDDMASALIPRLNALLIQEAAQLGLPPPPSATPPRGPIPEPARFTHCPTCGAAVIEEATA